MVKSKKHKINVWMVFRKNWIKQHPEITNSFEASKLASIEYNKLKGKRVATPLQTPTKSNGDDYIMKEEPKEEKDKIIALINNGKTHLEIVKDGVLINSIIKHKFKDLQDIDIMIKALQEIKEQRMDELKEQESKQQMESRIGTFPYPQSVNRCKYCGKAIEGFEFCSEPCYNTYNSKKEVKPNFFKRNWRIFVFILLVIGTYLVIHYWNNIKSLFV